MALDQHSISLKKNLGSLEFGSNVNDESDSYASKQNWPIISTDAGVQSDSNDEHCIKAKFTQVRIRFECE
jgi:hypothetical protein